ncbi:transcriptional repressor LexA [Parvibium lacunae]|uniref:LexA repressor n=1 Tax=Parvibium lacunae TaxID=1888893 RepID=A0A368L8B1_9BURK|nr:transcriptional repressor LexA [Parvibium lacunae]RCS59792.1 transcriptional repressor LexA [Parvibium lacunae]
MRGITSRQAEILSFILQQQQQQGVPPTRAEIAAHFGFRSANAAEMHLQALARKALLELTPGASRAIKVTPAGLKALGDSDVPHAAQWQSSLREEISQQVETKYAAAYQAKLVAELQEQAQALADKFGAMLNLPLVGRVAAGSPILAQEHVERTYQVDPAMFNGKADYLLKVRGMSMRDIGILDGDLLAVQRAADARNGQIVVARVGEEVTVKRLHQQGHVVELIAENPDYEPIMVDLREGNFAIEGIAVGLIRPDGLQ